MHFIRMQGRGSGNVVEEFCAESSSFREKRYIQLRGNDLPFYTSPSIFEKYLKVT